MSMSSWVVGSSLCSALVFGSMAACGEDAPPADAPPDGSIRPDDAGRRDAGRSPAPSPYDAGPANDAAVEPVRDTGASVEPDPVDVPSGTVPVFVAQGAVGRTTVSCDGRRWLHNGSLDDDLRCFEGVDCDHHPGAAKGITYANGRFVATWGWGSPGGIDRTTDGAHWTRMLADTTFGGIAFGHDTLLAATRYARVSDDLGETWSEPEETGLQVWNVRRAAFVPANGGLFVMAGEDDGRDVLLSADAREWMRPSVLPAECAQRLQWEGGIAGNETTIVMAGGEGTVCTSDDGGNTWSSQSIAEHLPGHLVWTGTEFMVWGEGKAFRSPDGRTWSSASLSPPVDIGPAAYHPATGTFVASWLGWGSDEQRFYRSEDGVRWETLAAGSFVSSHGINFIAPGYLPAAVCAE